MIFAYRLTLTSTAQQLPKIAPKHGEIRFSTPSGNSGAIYLSDAPVNVASTTTRFAIPANRQFPFKITDLSQLYAHGTSGDYLDMITETDSMLAEAESVEIRKKGGEDEPSQD